MNCNMKRINLRQPAWPKSSLTRRWLNLKVLLTSKALKLYTTLSLTLMTDCFAPMCKRKLDKCMMNCDDRLRCFSEMLTNWHWMSSKKIACIRGKWLCMTCSKNKVWTLIFVKKFAHLSGMCTYTCAYLSGRLLYVTLNTINNVVLF